MGHYLFCFGLLLHLAMPSVAVQETLDGVVLDSLTNHPIAHASLLLSRTDGMKYSSQQTDSAGKFSFTGLPNGTYDLFVSADGYKVLRLKHVEVSATESQRLTIRLVKGNLPNRDLQAPCDKMPVLKPGPSLEFRIRKVPVDTTVRYQ